MLIHTQFNGINYSLDLSKPIDISIPLDTLEERVSAWYVPPVHIDAVRTEQFVGSVAEGGSVNFRNITFNPHGNGTHTECVGHISEEVYSINKTLNKFFFWAELVTIEPRELSNGDQVIVWEDLEKKLQFSNANALIIRTLPNTEEKVFRQYSQSNPPYLEEKVMENLIQKGIDHFLIDLPSVDREFDEGKLAAHHAFWEHPKKTNLQRTITELIYVPETVMDGLYLLNLQIAPFENDASPSKPVLYIPQVSQA